MRLMCTVRLSWDSFISMARKDVSQMKEAQELPYLLIENELEKEHL